MNALALALCVALGAEPQKDAPTVDAHLEPGQPAPFAGHLTATPVYVAREQVATHDHDIAEAVKPGSGIVILPAWSVVAIAVAGVVLGGAVVGIVVAKPWEKK